MAYSKKAEISRSIYQMKSGKWAAAAELPRERGEKRNRKVFYGSTEKEARNKLLQFIFDYENGDYIEKRKDSLISFLEDYYSVSEPKWQPTTKELYKMYINTHFKPYFKETKLIDIKPLTLDKFYNEKMNEKIKVKVVKDGIQTYEEKYKMGTNTALKLNSFLKSAFDYAIQNDYIKKNPADNVLLPKKVKYKPNVYNEENFKNLLDAIRDTDDMIPIVLGAGCGLRRGEVFGLRWGDIDFTNNTIAIEVTQVRFMSNIEKKPKNETSQRIIKAPPYVIETLSKYRPADALDTEKIITRWKPSSYSERFKLLLEKHNLPHIRFHDLRHFNAIVMLKYGISDKVAAERLGHAQISTLRTTYQHVLKEMDEAAANELSKIFE